jgi:hypothetical protein
MHEIPPQQATLSGTFIDSAGNLWRLNKNGNYCRYEDGKPPDGVIFERDGVWRGLSCGPDETRMTKPRRAAPEDAAEALVQAEAEGPDSELWAPPFTTAWQPSKPRAGRPGFWRKRDGSILSVRQCKPHPSSRYPASWTASLGPNDPVMNGQGQPWHASGEAAMQAADAEYERRVTTGDWPWSRTHESADPF